MVVVHRHARIAALLRAEYAGRGERIEREAPLRDAPVHLVLTGQAPRAVRRAGLRVDDLEVRRLFAKLPVGEAPWNLILGFQSAVMQEPDVGRVDVALEDLQPVALQLRRATS